MTSASSNICPSLHPPPTAVMLTTQPHLRTRRPSPTTVEYTVSTCPTPTLPLRLLILATFLVRTVIGFSVLLLLYSKFVLTGLLTAPETYEVVPPFFTNDYIWYCVSIVASSELGVQASRVSSSIPFLGLFPISLAILYTIFRRIHTEESLLVLRGLGIQTSTSSGTYLSTATTRFIPTEKIQDVFVNEAFRGFEARYFLVVVVEGEEEVVVVFPRLLPRRKIVETVWRGARSCLYEPDRGKENSKS